MGDVTDRMAMPSRNRLVREGSGMSSSGSSTAGALANKDLKALLNEQEPLSGSSSFSAKQVDEIMQQTAKQVGDVNVDWMKRITMVTNF